MDTGDFNSNPANAQPPRSYNAVNSVQGTSSAPTSSPSTLEQGGQEGVRTSLLDEIATEDTVEEPEKKESVRDLLVLGMSLLMRITFYIDHQRRKYPLPFKILKMCWNVILSFILITGLLGLFLLISLWISFTDAIETELKKLGVNAQKITFAETGFTRTVIKDLTDKKGTYKIKEITLTYTLSDLLKKKIKTVELSDVKVMAKENEEGFDLGQLPDILLKMTQNSSVSIKDLSIRKATLDINGKNFNLPLNFSVLGMMSREAVLDIPFSIQQDELKASGNLKISGNDRKRTYEITLTNGILMLPKKAPENFKGVLTVEATKGQVKKITGTLDTSYGKNSKNIVLDLAANTGKLEGSVEATLNNVDLYDQSQQFKTNVKMFFSDLTFLSDIHHILAKDSIKIDVNSFENSTMKVLMAESTVLGKLECKNFDCSYQLTAPANVSVKNLKTKLNNQDYVSRNNVTFTILPVKAKEVLGVRKGNVFFDLILQNLKFTGYQGVPSNPVEMDSGYVSLKGKYNTETGFEQVPLRMERLNYDSNGVKIQNAILNIADFNQIEKSLKFQTSRFKLKNSDLFLNPVSFKMDHSGTGKDKTKIDVGVENDAIKIYLTGNADMVRDEFTGTIESRIALDAIKKPLASISSLFPSFVTNPVGQLNLLGEVTWKNAKQIKGPMYVGLKDVGFTYKNQQIEGINAAVKLDSIVPFETGNNQQLFVQRIRGSVPFQNTLITFKMGSQIAISSLKTQMGVVPLSAGARLIPLGSSGVSLQLTNGAVQVADLEKSLQNPVWGGTGTFTAKVPLEINADGFFIKSGILENPINVSLKRKVKTNSDLALLFGQNDTYPVRTGRVLLNTNEQGITNIQVLLEGKTAGFEKYRKTLDVSLSDLLRMDTLTDTPKEITDRQRLLF